MSTSGTGTLLDQEDDYCKTYAVLVDGLKQLLDRMQQDGNDDGIQLELYNQTRAAVSTSIPLYLQTVYHRSGMTM